MRAIDLRQLIEDEVDDNVPVIFKATINGVEHTFTLPEEPADRDFKHEGEGDDEKAILVIDLQG